MEAPRNIVLPGEVIAFRIVRLTAHVAGRPCTYVPRLAGYRAVRDFGPLGRIIQSVVT
jgi:hypothetical protein